MFDGKIKRASSIKHNKTLPTKNCFEQLNEVRFFNNETFHKDEMQSCL